MTSKLFFWADIEYARRAGERWIQSFDAEAPQGRFIKYVEEFVSTVPGIHERAVSAVNQFVATAPSWFGGGRLEIHHEAQNPEADVTYRFVSERTQRRGGLPLIGPVAPRRFVESA